MQNHERDKIGRTVSRNFHLAGRACGLNDGHGTGNFRVGFGLEYVGDSGGD
jgi:hypothetical protein